MASKEGGCHFAHFITAALKPRGDGDLIPCHAGAAPGAEREGGSFELPRISLDWQSGPPGGRKGALTLATSSN